MFVAITLLRHFEIALAKVMVNRQLMLLTRHLLISIASGSIPQQL